jgi:tetratricopeptide (TPR) repeat protein
MPAASAAHDPAAAADGATIAERFIAVRRRTADEPPSAARDARRMLLDALDGHVGELSLESLADASAAVRIPAAGVLALLEQHRESFALLARHRPADEGDLIAVALRVLPRLPPALLSEHRAWVSQFVAVLLRGGSAARFPSFVRALHRRGHFELVSAIRGSIAKARLGPDDELILDATEACWAGRYDAVLERLAERPKLDDATRHEADLLAAIARGAQNPAGDAIATLDGVRATPNGPSTLTDAAARWRAELLVRQGTDIRAGAAPTGGRGAGGLLDRVRQRFGGRRHADSTTAAALREASDHPALRLVNWIDLLRQPDDGRRDALRDFHEWVIARLCDERVQGIEPLAAEWRDGGGEAALWKIVALFGGNRTDTCTVVESGRLRAVDVRTARQEAVVVQGRLRQLGLEATLHAFDELSTCWPALTVYRTYKAELLLWVGRYDEAASLFDQIRRSGTNRWAHVGLGAALAALGRDDEAERVWEEGVRVHRGALPGEATFVYRAAVAMRRDRLDEADECLRRVLAAKPTRLRGWLQRAELAYLRGASADGRAALLQAVALCPGLFGTVAGGEAALVDLLGGGESSIGQRDAAIELCRSSRAAMRGNASSWLFTWFDHAGELRAFAHLPAPDMLLALQRLGRIGATS